MVKIREDFFHKDNPNVDDFLKGKKKVVILVHPDYYAYDSNSLTESSPSFSGYQDYADRFNDLIRKSKYPVIVFQDSRYIFSGNNRVFYVPTEKADPTPYFKYYGRKGSVGWDHVFNLLKNHGVKTIVLGGSYAYYWGKRLTGLSNLSPSHISFKDRVLVNGCLATAYYNLARRSQREGIKIALAKKIEFPGDRTYHSRTTRNI